MSCGFPRGHAVKQAVHLLGPMPIGVMREDARACGSRDRAGTCFSEASENGSDFIAIRGNEHFGILLEEVLDAGPFVRDQTGLCSRGLEDPRRWREAVPPHAVAA